MDTNTNFVMDTISHSPSACIFGACCVFYLVVYPIVKYYQDPKGLRKYPNMTLFSGISDIPFMILAHTGARSRELIKIHKKRPVLRTGPNTLSYKDPRAIKDIYGHGTKCTKDGSYVIGAGSHYHLADVVDKSDHARKRKVLSSAYALKNLEGWEHKVADKTARAIRHFDKCCTTPLSSNTTIPAKEDVNLDYRKWMNFFTLDAIADIGLSEKLGFLDRGSDEVMGRKTDGTRYECNLRECLYASNRKQSLLIWSYDYYKVIDKLANFVPFYGRLGKLGAKWDGVPLDLSYRRLERYRAGEKLDDFFQSLMEDKNGNPNNLEMGEIVAEVSIMMNAGSVTTAVAMTNIIYQLLKNPEIKKKLVEELDAALDDDNEDEDDDTSEDPFAAVVSYDRVKHLPYMRACLDESLRLFPPTPHNLGRQTPPEGATILGDYIPGGVSVGMTTLAVHWNEEVFPEPHKFIPERWLGEEGKNNQPYFLAFSAGARGCIGRNISYLEQTVVLASMLRRYEFALPHPDWEIERREGMNWLLGDMPVKIWRRQRVAV